MAVENTKDFHAENLKRNKEHYTYFVRSTRGLAVHKIQDFGANIHFNNITLKDNEHIKEMSNGEQTQAQIRYGVIAIDDMLRDLKLWETLLTSSFMQRPHEVLIEGTNFDKV